MSSGFPGSGLPGPLDVLNRYPPFDEMNIVSLFRFVQCNMNMVPMRPLHGSHRNGATYSYIHFDANKLTEN
jgi:hypothetical protein